MIKNFDEVCKKAIHLGPKTVAVACAQDDDVLRAIKAAYDKNMIKAILVGDVPKIKVIANEIGLELANIECIHIEDMVEASLKAVSLVSSGQADIVMKGLVDTAIILKAVLNKEVGLRQGSVLSHVAVFEVPTYHKLLFLTDAAMNIAPDLDTKKHIIENALTVTKAIGIELANVGVLAAKEKINPAMQATVDAGELVKYYENGDIKGCIIGGPFALDNAISKEAALIKGVKSPIAGDVDLLLCPAIESGNILYKALNFLANAKSAGVIVGAKAPVILTSRADSDESKLYSIALGVLMQA